VLKDVAAGVPAKRAGCSDDQDRKPLIRWFYVLDHPNRVPERILADVFAGIAGLMMVCG